MNRNGVTLDFSESPGCQQLSRRFVIVFDFVVLYIYNRVKFVTKVGCVIIRLFYEIKSTVKMK